MTDRSLPFFSVVIPAYNAEDFIADAVESVIAQTCSDWELIVVNDGSLDATANKLAEYSDKLKVIYQSNQGLSAARNTGIRIAVGKWVAFLDADDKWKPRKLEAQKQIIEQNSDIGFCSTHAEIIDPSGITLGEWGCPNIERTTLHMLFAQNGAIPGSGSGVVVRSDLFETVGGFDVSLRSLEDIDMWMRLAAVSEYVCIDDCLTSITRHADSMSSRYEVMRTNAVRVMKKNRDLLPKEDRGGFWRHCMVGVVADYAKWRYRCGDRWGAIGDLLRVTHYSPFNRGRLVLSLIIAMVLGQRI